jgi:hypothetical protein
MGKKSKAKRREFISQISFDGKISKKEGRKAAKKGISLRKIRNRRIGDYRQAAREFDRRGQSYRTPAAKRPTYEPLKIKRGAERADFARQMKEYQGSGRGGSNKKDRPKRDNKPDEFTPTPLPTDYDNEPTPTPTPPSGPSAEDLLAKQIEEMQAGFMQSMQEQQSMFQQMQDSQNQRMAALQQQMLQSQVNQSERPQVAGVKMADGSSGTASQVARRGMSGAFSRRGMRISSLNI